MGGSYIPRVDGTSNLFNAIKRSRIRFHWTPVKKLELFDPPFTVWSNGTTLPGGNRRKIEIRIE